MNHPWAVELAGRAASAAAELRMEAGIEVLEAAGSLWLRGKAGDEPIDLMLRGLPGAIRYEILADGQLRPEGKRLPDGRLPDGPWVAIKSWAAVELPLATLAARCTERTPIALERASTTDEPSILVAAFADWSEFAARAPQVRLEKLMFAASADGRVVVRGRPLPPIPGPRFYEQSGVAVACGRGWPSWLTADLVRATLEIAPGSLALFSPAGTWEEIAADQFFRATRSAVRLTAEAAIDPASGGRKPPDA